jgi:MmyB-like transcription regulator ligand binding domain
LCVSSNPLASPRRSPETALEAGALHPFKEAIDRLLGAHEPYPALVIDRHWNVLGANPAAATLFGEDLPRRERGAPLLRGAADALGDREPP